MSKFYFFTDPGLLDGQTSLQAFGPAGASAGKDQFRVTDLHQRKVGSTDDVPAFAICDGELCAQKDDKGTLTLILKPSQTPPFEAPVVRYFIYKGIDPNSLLDATGQQVLPNANDLTTTIAELWCLENKTTDLSGSCDVLGLDRDKDFLHDDGSNQTKIFSDNDPIERLFSYPHKSYQVPPVKAGATLGLFKNGCGFEIVLQRLGYKPKLDFARRADNLITVASLAATNGLAAWQPDDYAYFSHWHDKEQVLAFMDPCAYFGSFVQSRLYQKSGSSSTKVKGSDIYQEILQKFWNRNIAWLDIRNNYSYSYNLFGLYGDTIQFGPLKGSGTPVAKNFRVGSWPLLQLLIGDVPGSKHKSLQRTKLFLPAGLSKAPAVLISKGFVKRLGPERLKRRTPAIALINAGDTYYTPFQLAFPVTLDASQGVVFSCSYTRVNIYEKAHADPQSTAPLNIAGGDFLDGLFRLRDLQLDLDFGESNLRFETYPEEILIDLGSDFGPTYSGTVGIAQDAAHVTFFTFPTTFLPNDHDTGQTKAAASHPDKFESSSGYFQDWLTRRFPNTTITRTTLNRGVSGEVDVVITRDKMPEGRAKLTGCGQIADYCFVILEKSDHTSLLTAIASVGGPGVGWLVFSRISNTASRVDSLTNVPYHEKTLQATDYQPDGATAKVVKCDLSWSKSVMEYADF